MKGKGGIVDLIILTIILIFIIVMFYFESRGIHKSTLNNVESFPVQFVEVKEFPLTVAMLCKRNESCKYLAEAAYYESRGESDTGAVAVMHTVLNRVNHRRWPNTVKGVVRDKCRFSYVCDGSLYRPINKVQMKRMYRLAYMVQSGMIKDPAKGSTHYHTKRVSPYWKNYYQKTAMIGSHIFYRCTQKC